MDQVPTRLCSTQTLYALACATLAVYVVGGVTYRLWFSPIARFPGPKLAAATLWYEFYYDNVLNGQFTFKIMELHKQYGQYIHSQPQMDGVADVDPEVQSSVSTHMSCISTTLIIT